jgi:hypothetical protein
MQNRIWNLFDPGSGMEKFGSGIRDKHPGSAEWLRVHLYSFLPLYLNTGIYPHTIINNSSVVDADPNGSALILVGWIRTAKSPSKVEKVKKIHVLMC